MPLTDSTHPHQQRSVNRLMGQRSPPSALFHNVSSVLLLNSMKSCLFLGILTLSCSTEICSWYHMRTSLIHYKMCLIPPGLQYTQLPDDMSSFTAALMWFVHEVLLDLAVQDGGCACSTLSDSIFIISLTELVGYLLPVCPLRQKCVSVCTDRMFGD